MTTEIKSPTFPESVADGTIANWVKQEGEPVKQDEVIAEIETDKVVLEVVAPFDGTIVKILKPAGEVVQSAELIAQFEQQTAQQEPVNETKEPNKPAEVTVESTPVSSSSDAKENGPATKKLLKEHNLKAEEVSGSGKDGRITKADVVNHLEDTAPPSPAPATQSTQAAAKTSAPSGRHEERVPMSRLRSTIAKRLLAVKQETAMLTTFNEVNLQPHQGSKSKIW